MINRYPGGEISSKGYLYQGVPDGHWQNFYPDNQLKSEGDWRRGELAGTWVFYRPDGTPEKQVSYSHNLKNGIFERYDSSGCVIFKGFYVNDTLQGPYEQVRNDTLVRGNYKDGMQNGTSYLADIHSGQLIAIHNYDHDSLVSEEALNRSDARNRRHGRWKTFDAEGKPTFEGIYEHGKLVRQFAVDRYGVSRDTSIHIAVQRTYYPNRQLHTEVVLQEGLKNGYQRTYDSLGRRMPGKLYASDTLIAVGTTDSAGLYDGLWKWLRPDGSVSRSGSYSHGLRSGIWTFYFPDGSIEQTGSYRDDLPDGTWTWYYPGGQIRRIETLFRGQWNGNVQEFDETGKMVVNADYYADEKEGSYLNASGDYRAEGAYAINRKDGMWREYYDNGQLAFKGSFKAGEPEGKHVYYYYDGKKRLISKYRNGTLHGRKLEFDKHGNLLHTYFYKHGKLVVLDGESMN